MRKNILCLLIVVIISCQSKNDEKKSVIVPKPLSEIKIEKNNDSLIYKIDENTVVIDQDTLKLESPFIYSFEGKINDNKKIQLHLSNQLEIEYGGYSKTATVYIDGAEDIFSCYFTKDNKQDYYTANIDSIDDNKTACKLKLYKLSTEQMYIEISLGKKSYKIYPSKIFPAYKCFDEIDYTLFDSREAFKKEEAPKEFTPSRDYNFFAEILSNDTGFEMLETKLKYLNTDSESIKNYKKWKHSFKVAKSKNDDGNYSSENLIVVSPVFIDSNVFVVSNFSYNYMGGAHGFVHTVYDNYDVKTGTKIAIPSIINTKDKNFIALYENEIKAYFANEILEDKIVMTDNFYILPTGIIFSYTPNELIGLETGAMNIFFSYEELKPFILKNTILDTYNSN
ncbi:hypothetical protein [Flavobacterium aquidurense]|uniref:Putative dynein heavy chain n=1 Tax=Flavobacterium aquidurense TaxID=362413 RepID=A0A0Q0VZX3_9FLAO|nr:hypothetical protein [Flavobacterium aquidurense]KQB37473.1 putative dynein heavy chain [Flavobacterium aquidurense]